MSRLIVKNLPAWIKEERLREIFSQKGNVTDIQMKFTKDGAFRRFCFIGYQTEDEAQLALNYFNKSCIETQRIAVEVCAPLGDSEKPKSWSKYSTDSSAYQRQQKQLEEATTAEADTAEAASDAKKTKKKSAGKKGREEIKEMLEEHKDDPMFAEFMKIHSKEAQLWDNDIDAVAEDDEQEAKQKSRKVKDVADAEDKLDGDQPSAEESSEKVANVAEVSDGDYLKVLQKKPIEKKSTASKTISNMNFYTIKIFKLPYSTTRQEVMKFFKPLKPQSVRIPINNKRGYCYVGFKDEEDFRKAMYKNKSFIKGQQIFMYDFTEDNKKTLKKKMGLNTDEDNVEPDADSAKNSKWMRQETALRDEEEVGVSGRIYFRNLSYSVTEEAIQQLFEKYGPIAEVKLPIDINSRKIKGFGTVTFLLPENAVTAFSELDGHIFQGRMLHLLPGKSTDKEKELDEDDELNKMSFKAKKAKKLKKQAGLSHNWNTLFMGTNIVAEILAKSVGLSKEVVLNSAEGGSGAAVQLALAETKIVRDMKKFLEENGVYLKAFDGEPQKRSKTVMLVKNLPVGTTLKELRPLFEKFGLLGRLLLPESGVTAIAEFQEPYEAKKAFQGLAYSKFKTVPLYLEWAPENTFQDNANTSEFESVEKTESEEPIPESSPAEPVHEMAAEEELFDSPPEPDTTLFLRNLNYITVEDTIRNHFKALGPIHMVQVARRKDQRDPTQKVSLGYGFIQFKQTASAVKALQSMAFTTIDSNKVELKKSDRTLKHDHEQQQQQQQNQSARDQSKVKQTGSKILVRNIPFQAKESEIRDLFKVFGDLRSVRLPLKMTPGETSHRGFGFVDFVNKLNAKTAFDSLQMSTHLYGRRLVLEWAAEESNVQDMRKRTADTFVGTESKRSRKGVFDASDIDRFAQKEDEDE